MDARTHNLAALLATAASRHPERLAIVDGSGSSERSITYGKLAARAQRFAAGLAAQGVERGNAVLVLVPPSIDLYVALLGCFHLGAVAMFVDTGVGRRRIDAAIDGAAPRAVVGVPRAHLFKLVSPALRRIPIQIMAGSDWFPLERHERPALAGGPAEVGRDELALLTFGLNGTGLAKSTGRTHGFLMARHEALNRELGVTADDVDLSGAPRFVLNDLGVGATAVLPLTDPRQPAQTDPAQVFGQIERHRATLASGSPAFFDRVCQWCVRHGKRLPLRGIHTDGAPLAPTLARVLADTVEGRVLIVYGAADVEPIAAIEARTMLSAMLVRDANGHPPDGVCAGHPSLEVKLVRLADGPLGLPEGGWAALEVPDGEVGEIVVAGAHVPEPSPPQAPAHDGANGAASAGESAATASPAGEPAAAEPGVAPTVAPDPDTIRDGATTWRRTGDAGRFDSQGRLWLMGRVARRVRREGRVWWPIPAEVRALKVAGVRHAAYLGVPDPRYAEKAVLCVETTGSDLLPVERERLRVALAPMPVDEVHAMRRIPRDPAHESQTDVDALVREIAEIRPAVL